jgi:hypothetical protein
MSRRALAAPLLLAAILTSACGGSSDDAAPAAATTPAPVITASSVPVAHFTEDTGKPGKKGSGKPTVAPEVIAPSTTDAKAQQVLAGDWETRVVSALRQVDARLVADQPAAVKKVRATCKQMETGMFSTKVIPIIAKRFSSTTLTVTPDMAQDIYSVLLQDACYIMNES